MDRLRRAWEELDDQSAGSTLSWLALVSILRSTSGAGTAPWQYILPNKTKKSPLAPFQAFSSMVAAMRFDMIRSATEASPRARMFEGDARTLTDVSTDSIDLVITSPPYPNNYDYADSTRLEMSFFGEVSGWGDL
ncbi:MAG: hypothetical protein H0V37_13830 [Chloroflexia bacterium]|nr:hypothetical protein [Chloroflexia bacterium]